MKFVNMLLSGFVGEKGLNCINGDVEAEDFRNVSVYVLWHIHQESLFFFVRPRYVILINYRLFVRNYLIRIRLL